MPYLMLIKIPHAGTRSYALTKKNVADAWNNKRLVFLQHSDVALLFISVFLPNSFGLKEHLYDIASNCWGTGRSRTRQRWHVSLPHFLSRATHIKKTGKEGLNSAGVSYVYGLYAFSFVYQVRGVGYVLGNTVIWFECSVRILYCVAMYHSKTLFTSFTKQLEIRQSR